MWGAVLRAHHKMHNSIRGFSSAPHSPAVPIPQRDNKDLQTLPKASGEAELLPEEEEEALDSSLQQSFKITISNLLNGLFFHYLFSPLPLFPAETPRAHYL